MSVGFGFSVGDFLAVAELACTISRALSDSRGSHTEYRTLIQLLNSTSISLQTVSTFIVSSSSTSGLPSPDRLLLDGLWTHLSCCQKLMKDFLEESIKYTESFAPEQEIFHKWGVVREWRKVKWRIFHSDDARRLEERLRTHVDAFQLYMIAISYQSQARTQRAINENLSHTKATRQQLDELPKALGYSWEGSAGPRHGVVILEDVLGREVELPVILCRDFESFHDTLEIMFRDRPGHKRVTIRDYNIEGPDGNLIEPTEWERQVLPGVRIAMNVLLRQSRALPTFEAPEVSARKCPRCEAIAESAVIGGSIKCGDCGLIFRTTDTERTLELEALRMIAPSSFSKASVPELQEEEDSYQRIHYIREFWIPPPLLPPDPSSKAIDSESTEKESVSDKAEKVEDCIPISLVASDKDSRRVSAELELDILRMALRSGLGTPKVEKCSGRVRSDDDLPPVPWNTPWQANPVWTHFIAPGISLTTRTPSYSLP